MKDFERKEVMISKRNDKLTPDVARKDGYYQWASWHAKHSKTRIECPHCNHSWEWKGPLTEGVRKVTCPECEKALILDIEIETMFHSYKTKKQFYEEGGKND